MPKKLAASKPVHHGPGHVPKVSAAEVARLVANIGGPVDTSDIPEHKGPLRPVKRDANGHLPEPLPEVARQPDPSCYPRPAWSPRDESLSALEKGEAAARLPRSAVYEYLRGQRSIGVTYIEALIEAAGLAVSPVATKKAGPRAPVAAKAL